MPIAMAAISLLFSQTQMTSTYSNCSHKDILNRILNTATVLRSLSPIFRRKHKRSHTYETHPHMQQTNTSPGPFPEYYLH